MADSPQRAASDLTPGEPIAVVTGASGGIGLCYARRLAASGYQLILVARDAGRLESARRELEALGKRAVPLVADLGDPAEIVRVATMVAGLPRLDFLVNNAGFGTMGDFVDVEPAVHESMIQVHCTATVRLCHGALRLMRRGGGGTIVNVASMSAFLIGPGQVTYAATKAMLVTFTESLQGEWDRSQIRMQVLCPGFTRTGFHDRPSFARFDRSQIPSRAWMTPEQVVEASFACLKSRHVLCVPGIKNRWITRLLTFRKFRELAGRKVRKR